MVRRYVLLAVVVASASTSPSGASTSDVVADWQMSEPATALVMRDSSGHGLDGAIGTGVIPGGGVYLFPRAGAGEDSHRVIVPHSTLLNPGYGDWSVYVRYKTIRGSENNVVLKGNSHDEPGFWKFELQNGSPNCGWVGSGTHIRVFTPWAGRNYNDGRWHETTCRRLHDRVTLTMGDGTVYTKMGVIGKVTNTKEVTVGGEIHCGPGWDDCDPFIGVIDKVRLGRF